MFVKPDGQRSAYDRVLANVVSHMQRDKRTETDRETRRGKVAYPPAGSGKFQFGDAPVKKKSPFRAKALMDMLINMRGEGRPAPKHYDFRPEGKLDTSQVEDRRSFDPTMQHFGRLNAMMGDGRLERPAPMDIGLSPTQDMDYALSPRAGGALPQELDPRMLQLLQMMMAAKGR